MLMPAEKHRPLNLEKPNGRLTAGRSSLVFQGSWGHSAGCATKPHGIVHKHTDVPHHTARSCFDSAVSGTTSAYVYSTQKGGMLKTLLWTLPCEIACMKKIWIFFGTSEQRWVEVGEREAARTSSKEITSSKQPGVAQQGTWKLARDAENATHQTYFIQCSHDALVGKQRESTITCAHCTPSNNVHCSRLRHTESLSLQGRQDNHCTAVCLRAHQMSVKCWQYYMAKATVVTPGPSLRHCLKRTCCSHLYSTIGRVLTLYLDSGTFCLRYAACFFVVACMEGHPTARTRWWQTTDRPKSAFSSLRTKQNFYKEFTKLPVLKTSWRNRNSNLLKCCLVLGIEGSTRTRRHCEGTWSLESLKHSQAVQQAITPCCTAMNFVLALGNESEYDFSWTPTASWESGDLFEIFRLQKRCWKSLKGWCMRSQNHQFMPISLTLFCC